MQTEKYKLGAKGELLIEITPDVISMKTSKEICEAELAKKKIELKIWQARLDYIKGNEA